MMEQEKFESYLIGNDYKISTVKTYGRSIHLIDKDFKTFLFDIGQSIYDIIDSTELQNLYGVLYAVPTLIAQERTQRKRKSSAFQRYIEFRKSEEEEFENQNESQIKDIEQSRTEGGKKIVISKVVERNLKLRRQAIEIHGTNCYGCNFNFKNVYGSLGADFIEIHHVKLLSSTTESIITDPTIDLIPLCSNCHRMVHRRKNYVLSLNELKKIITKNNSNK